MVIVCKFGGTSTKDGQTLERVIDSIIIPNMERRVVVVSAPAGITNLLMQVGERYHSSGVYPRELVEQVKERYVLSATHLNVKESFLSPHFDSLEEAIKNFNPDRERYLDTIKPYGEIINAELLAAALIKKGINGICCRPENVGMIGEGNHGNAKILPESYQNIARALKPILEQTDQIVVFPGFYLIDKNGEFMTFSRGGSDLTGAILANALDAELYENWTDVNGIARADPKVIRKPRTIKRLTYQEARELAYSGAKVLHPDTLIPLIEKGIPLHVRNTLEPWKEGTYIGPSKLPNGHVVEGIAHKEGFTFVYVEKIGMNDEIGYLDRFVGIFADHGISIDQITTSVDSVSVALSNSTKEKIEAAKKDILEKGLADRVNDDYDKALICVVGEGMRHTPGVLQRVSKSLARAGINIETVYQGPSERSIIFGIDQSYAKTATQALYNSYFGNPIRRLIFYFSTIFK